MQLLIQLHFLFYINLVLSICHFNQIFKTIMLTSQFTSSTSYVFFIIIYYFQLILFIFISKSYCIVFAFLLFNWYFKEKFLTSIFINLILINIISSSYSYSPLCFTLFILLIIFIFSSLVFCVSTE